MSHLRAKLACLSIPRLVKMTMLFQLSMLVYLAYCVSLLTYLMLSKDLAATGLDQSALVDLEIAESHRTKIEQLRHGLLAELEAERARVQSRQLGDLSPADITIVSLYFKLKKSPAELELYRSWHANFFRSVSTLPLVVYTDRESVAGLAELAAATPNPKTFYVLDDARHLTRLIELDRSIQHAEHELQAAGAGNASTRYLKDYYGNYKRVQHRADPRSFLNPPDLYSVRNSKPFVMRSASARNVYRSKFFFYVDMSAFRQSSYPEWPDAEHLLRLAGLVQDRLLFGQLAAKLDDPFRASANFIQGTYFAGTPRALAFYYDKYYEIHDALMGLGEFVGRDERLMNIFAQASHPQHACKVRLAKLASRCLRGDGRFAFAFYFARVYHDREPSFLLNSAQTEQLAAASTDASQSPECLRSSKLFLANTDTIYCNRDTEIIALPKCFKCS